MARVHRHSSDYPGRFIFRQFSHGCGLLDFGVRGASSASGPATVGDFSYGSGGGHLALAATAQSICAACWLEVSCWITDRGSIN